MTYKRPALEKMITSTSSWTVDPQGLFIVSFFDNNFDERDAVYTRDEFAEFHPQLPDAVQAMSSWVWEKYNVTYVYGYSIDDTLSYLKHGALKLDITPSSSRRIASIAKMHEDSTTGFVLIKCVCIDVVQHEHDGKSVEFVSNKETFDLELSLEELDRQYPGALVRWQLGSELGLTNGELMNYAFTLTHNIAELPGNVCFP